jgi:hypothetical protein
LQSSKLASRDFFDELLDSEGGSGHVERRSRRKCETREALD